MRPRGTVNHTLISKVNNVFSHAALSTLRVDGKSQIQEAFQDLLQYVKDEIDILNLSPSELDILGFNVEWIIVESDLVIRLIPSHFLECIPEGTTVYSITGSSHVIGVDKIDTESRNGSLAYGIRIN